MHLLRHVLIAVFLAATLGLTPAALAQPSTVEHPCPTGTSPAPWQSVGDLFLPAGAIPYSTVVLTRLTLDPGETLPAELDVPIMYVVESGVLEYPSQAGPGILWSLYCLPDDGRISMSSSITTSDDDFIGVKAGQTLVAEHGLEGPLRNGGTMPLVLLEVRVIVPEIDPATGLPIVDPVIAAREQNRDLRLRKEACRARARAAAAGTPVAAEPEAPAPPPAFTTAGWASDAQREPRQTPRACKGARAEE